MCIASRRRPNASANRPSAPSALASVSRTSGPWISDMPNRSCARPSRDQRERGFAVPDALAALVPHHVRHAKIPVGDNLDGDVRLRLADGQGAEVRPGSPWRNCRPARTGPPCSSARGRGGAGLRRPRRGLRPRRGAPIRPCSPTGWSALRRSKRISRDTAIASGCSGSRRSAIERLLEAGGRLAVGRAHEDLGAGLV